MIVQRDLGAALLFFAVFLLLLYVSTARVSFVVLGLGAFVVGAGASCTSCSTMSGRASTSGSTRSPTRSGAGFQVVQALHAFARGGLIGTGLGGGLPTIAGRPPIPALHTDFPFAALGEELGLVGILAILGLYLVLVERGLRIAVGRAGRVPGDPRRRPVARHRRPGVHHRRRAT